MEKLNIRSAIVNGSLGTVGMALVKCLLEKGIETYAVCYPGDKRIKNLPTETHIIECDMRQIEKLKELIPGTVDAFFHLAWMGTIGPGRNDADIQTQNIQCAIDAVNSAKNLECQVFIGVGSQAEYGRIEGKVVPEAPCFPTTGYGIAKLCAGQMTRMACQQLGIRHVWARILSAYGPGDGPLSVIPTILGKLLKGEKPALTAGEQLWDFCYSGDAAEALYCMAISGLDGHIYPIGSGKVRPLREYFEIARDAVNPSLPLGIGELPYHPGQVMYLQADLTALRNETGFEPRTEFEEGIRITLEEYKRNIMD